MSFELTTSGACFSKAGANCSSTLQGNPTIYTKYYDQAQANLNAITRRDWLTLSGSTLTNFKGILDDVISDMVAMKIINYDMSGYTSSYEAMTMLDFLKDNIATNLACLKDDTKKETMVSSGS